MNRVASPLYPNTISGVVYQSGQFAPTWDGKLKPRLAKRTCILMLSGRSGSTRRSTACIRKRMLPVPKRKYRNVRDQRWGKCIFLSIAIRPNKKIRYSLLFVEVISYLFFYPLYFARNCAISSMQPSTSFSSATSAGICI